MKGKEAEEFGGGDYGVGPRWAGGSCTAKQVVILNFFLRQCRGNVVVADRKRRATGSTQICIVHFVTINTTSS